MKKKVVYFLFDFDGVLSLYLSDFNVRSPVYQKRRNEVPEYGRNFFDFFANQVSQTIENCITESLQDHPEVVLAIGSARQTRAGEKYSAKKNNQNGFCFTLYADLAREKGWHFNPLLLPDYELASFVFDKIGKTMGPLELNEDNKHVFKPDLFSDNLDWKNDQLLEERKQSLFQMHLEYLHQHYPASEYDVTLEFWDDEKKYIDGCHDYIECLSDSTKKNDRFARNTHSNPYRMITRHFDWQTILNGISKEMRAKDQLGEKLKNHIYSVSIDPIQPRLSDHSFWVTTDSPRSITKTLSISSDDEPTLEKQSIPYQWIGVGISLAIVGYLLWGSKSESKDLHNLILPSNK